MQSIQTIFAATLEEARDKPQFLALVKESTYELAKKKIQRLKDTENIQKRLGELFELFSKVLQTQNLENSETLVAIIDGLIKAASSDKEEFLYKTLYEKEQLEQSIIEQKKAIRENILGTFSILEKHIHKNHGDMSHVALKALGDAKLKGIEMLGILRETTSEALLTTLENSKDVEDTVFEITKNITYNAISEGEFTKERFMSIASTIIEATIEIADEWQSYTKELLKGSIHGTKEGMAKAIDTFKNDLQFAPQELEELEETDLHSAKKELMKIDESFVIMLENAKKLSNGVSEQIIDDLLENELNNSLAKIVRVAAEARETISEKLEELKDSAKEIDYSFMEKAGKKFEEIKKDVAELEKTASQKVEAFKNNDATKRATTEAKRLGNHAWQVAKSKLESAIKSAKESIKK